VTAAQQEVWKAAPLAQASYPKKEEGVGFVVVAVDHRQSEVEAVAVAIDLVSSTLPRVPVQLPKSQQLPPPS
jgi:hypothetical protein